MTINLEPGLLEAIQVFLTRASLKFDIVSARLFDDETRTANTGQRSIEVAIILKGSAGDYSRTKMDLVGVAYDVLLEHGVQIEPTPVWETELFSAEIYSNPRLFEIIDNEDIRF